VGGHERRLLARLARVALAAVAAFGFAGVGNLAAPGPVSAIDCNFILTPFAADDPTTPGDSNYTVYEDGSLFIQSSVGVLANDSCTTGASITKTGSNSGSWVIASNGAVAFDPEADFWGAAGADYRFTSNYGTGPSNIAHVTVTVVPINDKPDFEQGGTSSCPTIEVAEDSGPMTDPTCYYVGNPGGDRGEMLGQTLTGHAIADVPSLFSSVSLQVVKTANGGVETHLRWTPAPNASGQGQLSFWITDDGGTNPFGVNKSDVFQTSVFVAPVDDAPNAVNDSYATASGQTLVVGPGAGLLHNDTDVDGPSLSATKVSGPTHGSATVASDGSFSYTPASGYAGADSFTYRTTAGSLSDTATVTIQVLAADATVPPPTKAPIPTSAPQPSAGPSAVALASATPDASAGPTFEASASPSDTAPAATETSGPGPSATNGPGPVTESSGSDNGPWLIILLIIVIVVVGGNLALFQYRRVRRPPAA
jgi:hypothetical protein